MLSKIKVLSLVTTSISIIYSAIDKILFSNSKYQLFKKLFSNENIYNILIIFSIIDLILLVLYLIPKTRKFIFLISICYYSGALGMRISANFNPLEPL